MRPSWQTLPVRTRSRLIPSSTIIPRATDLLSVYSPRGSSFRLCTGRAQCSKASVVNRTTGSSTARCLSSTRCVLWPRASSARVWSRLSRVFPSQQRAGRGGFSLSTLDAPEVSACDHVDENARFKWQTLRAAHAALGLGVHRCGRARRSRCAPVPLCRGAPLGAPLARRWIALLACAGPSATFFMTVNHIPAPRTGARARIPAPHV